MMGCVNSCFISRNGSGYGPINLINLTATPRFYFSASLLRSLNSVLFANKSGVDGLDSILY